MCHASVSKVTYKMLTEKTPLEGTVEWACEEVAAVHIATGVWCVGYVAGGTHALAIFDKSGEELVRLWPFKLPSQSSSSWS